MFYVVILEKICNNEFRYTYETGSSEGADTFVVEHSSVSENEYKKAILKQQVLSEISEREFRR